MNVIISKKSKWRWTVDIVDAQNAECCEFRADGQRMQYVRVWRSRGCIWKGQERNRQRWTSLPCGITFSVA